MRCRAEAAGASGPGPALEAAASASIAGRMRILAPIVTAVFLALGVVAASAQARSPTAYDYTPCASVGDASVVQVVGAPCSDAEDVAAKVVAAPGDDAASVLSAAGWTPLRAQSDAEGDAYDLIAVRAGAALRIHRDGDAPDLDGWEAGRELVFSRGHLVGGGKVPSGSVLCTSSWLVRFAGNALGGLSAAHCGALRKDHTVQRRNVALRRPPQPGIVLGRVTRILTRSAPLDALAVPVPLLANRTAVPVIDRGVSRPPWKVIGVGRPIPGRPICFSGSTSGIDQCGSVDGRKALGAENVLSAFAGVLVRCTTIRGRHGDSGGPVYTAPTADGSVYAVGITTLIVGATARMCFTPLSAVLDALHAQLVTTSG